ncbi:1-deoxy-D-xylulose-5-phosphate synthase N-terminal domain-containing protein [Paraburkholderia mimosarum]|uniref:1-deoxy-D-xylulose-5-phosphate synthase N-terminal domain-containing protein n=1 Tax=Paraburkholderia mimosarum TaxID=312026 RepID=UPI0039C13C37
MLPAGSCAALPLTIILNDNRMSISPAVGGLNVGSDFPTHSSRTATVKNCSG